MKRLIVCFLLLTVLAMAGCSPRVKPHQTSEKFLDAMINSDFESASEFAGGVNPKYELDRILSRQSSLFGSEQEQDEILHLVLSKVTYELGDEETKGDEASVQVKISAPDCQAISRRALQQLVYSQSLMYRSNTIPIYTGYFRDGVVESGAPRVVSNVTVTLENRDGVWIVQLRNNDALLNSLTGGMANLLGL